MKKALPERVALAWGDDQRHQVALTFRLVAFFQLRRVAFKRHNLVAVPMDDAEGDTGPGGRVNLLNRTEFVRLLCKLLG